MWIYDNYKERKIFISRREVGRSQCFLEEFAIRSFVDLIRTNDEHSNDLSSRGKEKVYRQICNIVQQLSNSEGNVVVFCGRGRTRSPVHVAAYFIVLHCYTVQEAHTILSKRLSTYRGDNRGIDRDSRFTLYLDRLESETKSL